MTKADFLKAPFADPIPVPGPEVSGPKRFFNREL